MTATDFENLLDGYAGIQATYTPVTKTVSNTYGEETLTDGTTSNIKVHFVRINEDHDFEKYGLKEKGDAIMLAKYSDSVNDNDKVTINSVTYRIGEHYDVAGVFDSTGSGTTFIYTVCSLFLVE